MPSIHRSALVEHSASRMFDLVNDVAAYPRRFSWCGRAQVIEHDDARMLARLDLGLGSLSTWFTTENTLQRPHRIDMQHHSSDFHPVSPLAFGLQKAHVGHDMLLIVGSENLICRRSVGDAWVERRLPHKTPRLSLDNF